MKLQTKVVYEELTPEDGTAHIKEEQDILLQVEDQAAAVQVPRPSSAPAPSAMPSTSLRLEKARKPRAGANPGPSYTNTEEGGAADPDDTAPCGPE